MNPIKKLLIDNGFGVFSVRKKSRSVGGTGRYNLHGSLRERMHTTRGKPVYFYQIELKSETLTGDGSEDYDLANLVLKDAGYKSTNKPFEGLRVAIT